MSERSSDAPGARKPRSAVDLLEVRGALERAGVERAVPAKLAAGQTGLSIAFDLPTRCGCDPDHPLAVPEVGKVGVPIATGQPAPDHPGGIRSGAEP